MSEFRARVEELVGVTREGIANFWRKIMASFSFRKNKVEPTPEDSPADNMENMDGQQPAGPSGDGQNEENSESVL